MRIIHSSDWHLGKNLEGISRIEEQEEFCEDFIELVEKEKADMVIIAGDIYDTYNPPAIAESLFYNTIEKLSDGGKRCVYIIAGNHDNPDRLESVKPLVSTKGIIILGYPLSKANVGKFKGFEILEAKEGFTKIKIKDEVINVIGVPYPSEKRLNDAIDNFENIEDMQESYSQKLGDIFESLEKNYRDDEINIAVSHLFVVGSEKSESERRIELGGSLLVEKSNLPKKSQYTALGHIHKPQRISKKYNAYYSGSPIQYSKSERNTSKSVYVVDIKAQKEAEVSKIYTKNYKQIILFECESVEEAIEICEKKSEEDIFAYFEVRTKESLKLSEIRKMKKTMKHILEIKPIIESIDYEFEKETIDINKSNISEYFIDFYKKSNDGLEPSEEVKMLFESIVNDEEEVQ
ncbi:MAG: exonuclease subunit SbcD [Peptostreptococcus sp.]|uniref:metallophosphoesterase family protein n=1 Tax=Peptostreptococcus sp. TaxID=1262 RepID=UPI002FC8C13F